MKIALISTPRSGNTWIRRLLSDIYSLQEYAVHNPTDLCWENLPDNVIVQIHWSYSLLLSEKLRRCSFRVITITRHPLDILISILHFSQHSKNTKYWLAGAGGNESILHGANPLSNHFLDYAVSERAYALFDISMRWSKQPSTITCSYEKIVKDPINYLEYLASVLGGSSNGYRHAVKKNDITELRKESKNFHFWQGQPYLWTELLTIPIVNYILENQAILENSDYSFEANKDLNQATALNNWGRIQTRSATRDRD